MRSHALASIAVALPSVAREQQAAPAAERGQQSQQSIIRMAHRIQKGVVEQIEGVDGPQPTLQP